MAYLKHFKKCEITRRDAYTAEQIELLRVSYRIAATNAASGHGNVILFNEVNGRFSARSTTYYGERPCGELFDIIMPRDLRETPVVCYLQKVAKDIIQRLEIIE